MTFKSILHRSYNHLPILAFVITMALILIPIHPFVLDILIGLNIVMSIALIMIVFTKSNPLQITSFPSLLLLATLFRFSLNISSTRLILSKANAGLLIESVGKIVIQDNLLIGIIIFVILSLVQYFIISKGSERVAEVAARFNLDALPGKQMSIDADLRAGIINSTEAKEQRSQLQVESKLYGALDGSMKFIKGDAVMGWLMILINLAGGFYVGMVQIGYDFSTASSVYFILTIGDGLLNQIPSLILALSSGLIITRVQSEEDSQNLASDIMSQIFSHPKQILILSGVIFLSGFLPHIPWGLSFIISFILFSIYIFTKFSHHQSLAQKIEETIPQAEVTHSKNHEIVLEIGETTYNKLCFIEEWNTFFTKGYQKLTEKLYQESGIPYPEIHIYLNPKLNHKSSYIINVQGIPSEWGELYIENKVLLGNHESQGKSTETVYGSPITIISGDHSNSSLYSSPQMLTRHLYRVLKRQGHEFLGIHEVKLLLTDLELKYPDLIFEVVPKFISIPKLTELLKRLAQENISILNLKLIIENLAKLEPESKNIIRLTEEVRCGLHKYISHQFCHSYQKINVIHLDIDIEEEIRSHINSQGDQQFLSFDPERLEYLQDYFFNFFEKISEPYVVLTQLDIRRFVKVIIQDKHPYLPVLSFQEIDPQFIIHSVAVIKL